MVGMTAHFLDPDFNFRSLVISFRKFHGQHLCDRIKSFLISELNSLRILSKIASVTTDNGADIKKATEGAEFKIRYSCFAHTINLVVSSGFGFWKIPRYCLINLSYLSKITYLSYPPK